MLPLDAEVMAADDNAVRHERKRKLKIDKKDKHEVPPLKLPDFRLRTPVLFFCFRKGDELCRKKRCFIETPTVSNGGDSSDDDNYDTDDVDVCDT